MNSYLYSSKSTSLEYQYFYSNSGIYSVFIYVEGYGKICQQCESFYLFATVLTSTWQIKNLYNQHKISYLMVKWMPTCNDDISSWQTLQKKNKFLSIWMSYFNNFLHHWQSFFYANLTFNEIFIFRFLIHWNLGLKTNITCCKNLL